MEKIYLLAPHLGENELDYIHQALKTNRISTVGPQLNDFERQLAAYTGVNHAAALSSGTAAIHLGLRILGVTTGDHVLCQSFTFAASANPIIYQGATPVFIDSEKGTWNMDPNALEDAIKDLLAKGKNIKAIIPVHLYGMPANMSAIMEISGKYNIPVIEDSAEALGSKFQGRSCGQFGDLGILSFNGNKIITTSGGGALLSDKAELIEKAKFLATQARDQAPHYEHSEVGYNYCMGNINAAIGLGQMDALKDRVKRKREIFHTYKESFGDKFRYQNPDEKECFSNRWLTTILTDSFESREEIRMKLEKENIESRPLWKPMHLQPVFKDQPYYGGRVCEDLFNRGLCLPSGTNMSDSELNRIIGLI